MPFLGWFSELKISRRVLIPNLPLVGKDTRVKQYTHLALANNSFLLSGMATQRTPLVQSIVKTPLLKRSRTDGDSPGESMTLDYAVRMFMQQFAETKTLLDEMRTVKTDLESKLEAVTKHISSLRADCTTQFKFNDEAVNGLNTQVNAVSEAVSNLENRNDLIVSGIPFLQGEDLMEYFKAMLKHLGVGESVCPLVDIRRMYSRASNGKEAGLVKIQFALKNIRDDIYNAYLVKRDLQLCHLGINSNRRVYLNESLTAAVRRTGRCRRCLPVAGRSR